MHPRLKAKRSVSLALLSTPITEAFTDRAPQVLTPRQLQLALDYINLLTVEIIRLR